MKAASLMKVANPIYDVVFKYLLDDKKIAKLIISKILGEDIISLEFNSTEMRKKLSTHNFTVFRIDFSATIRQPDGSEKLVVIEIQKAKYHTDIMRFRKYLGGHYQNKNNVYFDEKTGKTKALPIISLYFLGHKLDHTDAPVVKVNRQYIDIADGSELSIKEDFIEILTHDSYIIQIPHLKQRRRNDLEILLSVFDQSLKVGDDDHFLHLNEDDYPKEFRIIVRRLLQAASEKDVCDVMELEDEILDELESLERTIFDKDKVIEDKDKVIEDKDKVIEDKDKVIEDKDNIIEEQNKILSEVLEALVDSGVTLDAAKTILNRQH